MFYEYFMLIAVLSAMFIRIKKLTYTNLSGTGFPFGIKILQNEGILFVRNRTF